MKPTPFRFCDGGCSHEINAPDIKTACERYFEVYDTYDNQKGDQFEVRIYGDSDLDLLIGIAVGVCDGNGGVESWNVVSNSARIVDENATRT